MKKKSIIALVFVAILLLSPTSFLTYSSDSLPTKEKNTDAPMQSKIGDMDTDYFAVIITVGNQKQDAKDSNELTTILTNNGWNEQNILYLIEEEATKESILTRPFEWLKEKNLNEDDVILFYFSMHGGQTNDQTPLDEPDNMDEYLVPYDYNATNNNILLDDELHIAFSHLSTQTIAIIFEACNSGGMVDGTHDLQGTKRVILMSASTDETSGSSLLFKRWLFPHYLLKGLNGPADNNNDNIITAEEAYTYAKLPTTLHSITLWIQLFIHPFISPHLQHPQLFDGYPTITENTEDLPLIHLQ